MTHDGPRILIIEAVFYPDIAEALRSGAMAALEEADAHVERIWVPGVLEIPAALAMAVGAGNRYAPAAFDGYVLLGCVIRGETSHYDIVAGESARAVMDLAVEHELALGNGILTVENAQQANVRASRDGRDKGGFAARAALAMIGVRRSLRGEKR
ncbi:6,7-dimethyl-8-ribityllumazine synthase [Microbaculum marinum]|uniref:6,7-dimethyl-8-ribityllumazine synthase n=1 Tax=Microbaculum marinum TaxID=1764581 RepID=A0AAW9RXJ8_9HYPH